MVWENLCLPPTPVVLSDLVFVDHFLPRDPSPKFDAVIPALRALRSASMIIIDDVAEFLFGQFAYPVLSHRFERSAAADLLVWRWQRYTERHHELPIGVLNLWQTQRVRNQFIERLGHYLGVPVFRIATLRSFEEYTAAWEFVSRSNADWTMELAVDIEALVSRLAEFIARERRRMPLRPGSDAVSPLSADLPHFCSMYADRAKIDAVLAKHDRFCVIGTDSSIPYVVRRIESLGKHWLRTNNLNLAGQGIVDTDFDCVLQTGSWGRPETSLPVYQLFTAGWNPAEQPATLNGLPITEAEFFHAPVTAAPSDGARPKERALAARDAANGDEFHRVVRDLGTDRLDSARARRYLALASMSAPRYLWQTHLGPDVAFDPNYHQNPRPEIVSFLAEPPGTVLDIGCGGGATGKLIKDKFPGTRIIGIELNAAAAEYARRFLDQVVCGRIEDVDLAAAAPGANVSTVLLLDVLEHLYDPWRALTRIKGWLAPGTRVLASVPNIRNLAVLDELAAGRFQYAENGVLDVTHVRFFTKHELRRMFEETGYVVRNLEPLTQPEEVDTIVVNRRPGRLDTRHLSVGYRDFDDLEDLYAFQYVIDAARAA